jgi:hypothetical protein
MYVYTTIESFETYRRQPYSFWYKGLRLTGSFRHMMCCFDTLRMRLCTAA